MHPLIRIYSSIFTLAVMTSLVPVLKSETACSMTLRENAKGDDVMTNFGMKTADADCNDACLADASCVAAKLNALCFYWTTLDDIRDVNGHSVYIKTCQTATTKATTPSTTATPTCSMDQSSNTDASNHKLELSAVSLAMCIEACKSVAQCQHFVFIQSSSACKLYTDSSVTTASQSGHMTAQRKSCDNGKNCCFDTTNDQTISNTATLTFTMSQGSCESLCLAASDCAASVYTGTSCKIFTSSPSTSASNGVTLATKNCPEGADSGSLTVTLACQSSASTISTVTFLSLLFVIGVTMLS